MANFSKKRVNDVVSDVRIAKKASFGLKSEKSKLDILDLNDDCLFEVFEFLSLRDLNHLSKVCHRMQATTGAYFARKHSHRWARYTTSAENSGNKLVNLTTQAAFQRFHQNLNLLADTYIYGDNHDKCHCRILKLICAQDSSEYKKIQFTGYSFCNDKCDNRSLNLLRKASTFCFWNCQTDETFPQKMLTKPQELKILLFYLDHEVKFDTNKNRWDWMSSMEFNSLEHFQFHCFSYDNAMEAYRHLRKFLQLNRNIKSLTWHFCSYEKELLTPIIKHGISLQELFLSFGSWIDLLHICNELKPLCERKGFKRLEINFCCGSLAYESMDFNGLSLLKNLTGLHFDKVPTQFPALVASLRDLKILRFMDEDVDVLSEIAQNMTNVEEVILDSPNTSKTRWPTTKQFNDCILPFVRTSPKLKTLTTWRDLSYKPFHTYEYYLNAEREVLTNATKLDIYLHDLPFSYQKCDESIVKLHDTSLYAFKTINIKSPFEHSKHI